MRNPFVVLFGCYTELQMQTTILRKILEIEIDSDKTLHAIHELLTNALPRKAVKIQLIQILEGKEIESMVSLIVGQGYNIRVKDEVDPKGVAVPFTGPFTFVLADPTFATLAVDADGLGCRVDSIEGKTGTGSVAVTDTANNLQATSSFTVGPRAATVLELTESAPTDTPTPA